MEIQLSQLNRADGSSVFDDGVYRVMGAVNGPVEAQRRDELYDEAVVDVTVRPASGVGGVGERHLESILKSTLRHVILVQDFPRAMIQVTLQVLSAPKNHTNRIDLPLLSALLQAAILSLISAAVPLAVTYSSTTMIINQDGKIVSLRAASSAQMQYSRSVHVLAFTSEKALLVNESEGEFTIDEWEQVYDQAKELCCSSPPTIDEERPLPVEDHLKQAIEHKWAHDQRWKQDVDQLER